MSAAADSPTAAVAHGAQERVLVVDDNPANVKLLEDLLGFHGYDVEAVSGGAAALARLRTRVPDLLLLDVLMPGMSGYEVCRAMRADPALAMLPVVMVTALDDREERVHGLEAGADDFLSKPLNPPELLARVRSLLRMQAPVRDGAAPGRAACGLEPHARAARGRAGARSSRSCSG